LRWERRGRKFYDVSHDWSNGFDRNYCNWWINFHHGYNNRCDGLDWNNFNRGSAAANQL
jgi:hypothetical protein